MLYFIINTYNFRVSLSEALQHQSLAKGWEILTTKFTVVQMQEINTGKINKYVQQQKQNNNIKSTKKNHINSLKLAGNNDTIDVYIIFWKLGCQRTI